MQIVVNHLTRMQRGAICVAGIDLATGRHARPVLHMGSLSAQLLTRNGGPFDLAALVDLGATIPAPREPEVEDCIFQPPAATHERLLRPDEFWTLLVRSAERRLARIFGPNLTQRGRDSAAVDAGRGQASLGCLVPAARSTLFLRKREGKPDQIRMRVSDGDFDLDLSVTELRLFGSDHATPNVEVIQRISERLKRGEGLILSVGLTRAFAADPERPPLHWLQVNNLHLERDPTWRLG